MKTVIPYVLGLFFSIPAFAADEAILVPDVTPATTTEFGFAKFLEEQVLIKLEGVGFLVLNDDVLNQTAQDETKASSFPSKWFSCTFGCTD